MIIFTVTDKSQKVAILYTPEEVEREVDAFMGAGYERIWRLHDPLVNLNKVGGIVRVVQLDGSGRASPVPICTIQTHELNSH